MNLKFPQKILIKIISHNNEDLPLVSCFSIDEKSGIEIVEKERHLNLLINEKNSVSVVEHYESNWISLGLPDKQRFTVFANDLEKKSKVPKINFNKNLSKECFSVIHGKFEKAINQYLNHQENITLILDVNEIVKETLSNLKKSNTKYLLETSPKEERTLSIKDLEAYFNGKKSREDLFSNPKKKVKRDQALKTMKSKNSKAIKDLNEKFDRDFKKLVHGLKRDKYFDSLPIYDIMVL